MKQLQKLALVLMLCSGFVAAGCSHDDDDSAPPQPDPQGFPGETTCRRNSAGTGPTCTGALSPACTQFDDMKCTTDGRCLMRLNDYAECADGHFRTCTLKSKASGIVLCDVSLDAALSLPKCEWAACKACGGEGNPCCVGGCTAPLVCSSVPGTAKATCIQPQP